MGGRLACSMLVVIAGCGDDWLPNHAPVVLDAQLATSEDTPVVYTVAALDPDADPIVIRASTAGHGAVSVDGDRISYTPAPHYHGVDAIVVTASDGELSATATLDVAIASVNDP